MTSESAPKRAKVSDDAGDNVGLALYRASNAPTRTLRSIISAASDVSQWREGTVYSNMKELTKADSGGTLSQLESAIKRGHTANTFTRMRYCMEDLYSVVALATDNIASVDISEADHVRDDMDAIRTKAQALAASEPLSAGFSASRMYETRRVVPGDVPTIETLARLGDVPHRFLAVDIIDVAGDSREEDDDDVYRLLDINGDIATTLDPRATPDASVASRLGQYIRYRCKHESVVSDFLSKNQMDLLRGLESAWLSAASDAAGNFTANARDAQLVQIRNRRKAIELCMNKLRSEQKRVDELAMDLPPGSDRGGVLKKVAAVRDAAIVDTWIKECTDELHKLNAYERTILDRQIDIMPLTPSILSRIASFFQPAPLVEGDTDPSLEWGFSQLPWVSAIDAWDKSLTATSRYNATRFATLTDVLVRSYESIFIRIFNTLFDALYKEFCERPLSDGSVANDPVIDVVHVVSNTGTAELHRAIDGVFNAIKEHITPDAIDADAGPRNGGWAYDTRRQSEWTLRMACVADMWGSGTHRVLPINVASGIHTEIQPLDGDPASRAKIDALIAYNATHSPWARIHKASPSDFSVIDPSLLASSKAASVYTQGIGENRPTEVGLINTLFEQTTKHIGPGNYITRMGRLYLTRWFSDLEHYCMRHQTYVETDKITAVQSIADTRTLTPAPIDTPADLVKLLYRREAIYEYNSRIHRMLNVGRILSRSVFSDDAEIDDRDDGSGSFRDAVREFVQTATKTELALDGVENDFSAVVTKELANTVDSVTNGDYFHIELVIRNVLARSDDLDIERLTARMSVCMKLIPELEQKWLDVYNASRGVVRVFNPETLPYEYKQAYNDTLGTVAKLKDTVEQLSRKKDKVSKATLKTVQTALRDANAAVKAIRDKFRVNSTPFEDLAGTLAAWGLEPHIIVSLDDSEDAPVLALRVANSYGLVPIKGIGHPNKIVRDGNCMLYPFANYKIASKELFFMRSLKIARTANGPYHRPDNYGTAQSYTLSFSGVKLNRELYQKAVADKTITTPPGQRSTSRPGQNDDVMTVDSGGGDGGELLDDAVASASAIGRPIAAVISAIASLATLLPVAAYFGTPRDKYTRLPIDSSLASRSARYCAGALLSVVGISDASFTDAYAITFAGLEEWDFLTSGIARYYRGYRAALRDVTLTGYSNVTITMVLVPCIAALLRGLRIGLPTAITRNCVATAILGRAPDGATFKGSSIVPIAQFSGIVLSTALTAYCGPSALYIAMCFIAGVRVAEVVYSEAIKLGLEELAAEDARAARAPGAPKRHSVTVTEYATERRIGDTKERMTERTSVTTDLVDAIDEANQNPVPDGTLASARPDVLISVWKLMRVSFLPKLFYRVALNPLLYGAQRVWQVVSEHPTLSIMTALILTGSITTFGVDAIAASMDTVVHVLYDNLVSAAGTTVSLYLASESERIIRTIELDGHNMSDARIAVQSCFSGMLAFGAAMTGYRTNAVYFPYVRG